MALSIAHYILLSGVSLLMPNFLLPVSGGDPIAKPIIKSEAHIRSSCNCTVTQGSFTAPLLFLSDYNSAVNFYSYDNPQASSANTGLEMPETMLLMMYEDLNTGATSLVLILDISNDATGGDGTVTFSCLPASAFIEFSDDSGELTGSPPTITGNFSWSPCCTDGGIIGGVGCGSTITINPSITSGINLFSLVYGTPGSPTYVNMPEINCPITINCGGTSCCDQAFEFSATTQNETCSDAGDGFIDISTVCAADPTFLWSNGAITEDLIGIDAGSYTVTITDINGCSQSKNYIINANNSSPNPSITGPTEYCAGDTPFLDVTGNYANYQWSTGATSPSIIVTGSGDFSVTVTNSGGCTGVASTTVTENPVPDLLINGPNAFCEGDTITLDAGPGFEAYLWSTGEFAQAIEVSQFGTYFVTVLNIFGCSAFDIVFVDPLNIPLPEITGPNNFCSQNLISLDAGEGYETYEWSTGANTQTIATTMPGTYAVTVTNIDGCEGFTNFEVSDNAADTLYLFSTSCIEADAGVYTNEYMNQYGCDSIVRLTISYSEADTIIMYDHSCMPQDTGTFIQTDTNQNGCDSVSIEIISLSPTNNFLFQYTNCNPQDTGTFVKKYTNHFGCDSTVTNVITLLPKDTIRLFRTSCSPSEEGVVEKLLINHFGCDSLVITTTSFNLVDTNYIYTKTCDALMSGIFNSLYTGSEGCDSLVITTVTLLPPDTIRLQGYTCDAGQVGNTEEILTNSNGCDSLVITSFSLWTPDTTKLHAFTCDVNQVGSTTEVVADATGCDSIVITTFSLLPPDTTVLQAFTCDATQVGTTQMTVSDLSGCDSLVITHTLLYPIDTTRIYYETCLVTDTGQVTTILPNRYGCDSLIIRHTSLKPASECVLMAQILGDTIGCTQTKGSLWITPFNGTPPLQYRWTDQSMNNGTGVIDQIGIPFQISGLKVGTYDIEISDQNGLVNILNAIISQTKPLSITIQSDSTFHGYNLSCYNATDGSAMVTIQSGGLPPYNYQWSDGSNKDYAEKLSEGWSFVTVSDAKDCETIDSIFLVRPDSLSYDLSISHPDCFTDGLGAIFIDQVEGGSLPYSYALNQKPAQANPLFNGLTSGNYLVVVKDANGCLDSTYLYLDPYLELVVSLGRDTILQYGDSLVLRPSINIDMDGIDSIYWEGIDCDGCHSVTIVPTANTSYSVNIIDTLGCQARDEMNVLVKQNYDVSIPNIFNPDASGINNHFTVFGGTNLVNIRKLLIFDRWGELVFSGINLPPGDPSSGWDGTFNGKELNPAVFVYLVEVEFIDGSSKQFVGDVLLVR